MSLLGARPQRRGLVDGLPFVGDDLLLLLFVPLLLLHQDRQRDVIGVARDDRLELPRTQEVLFALAQVQGHVGAARGLVDGFDLEVADALAAPAHALIGAEAGAPRLDRDAVGDDEAGVEADAELADQVGVLLLVTLQLGHELARAALGDGAQVLDRFVAAHADAVVADRQRLGLGVEQHAHFEVGGILVERRVVERLEAQLVAGVGRVGDQLAQEDLLVGVQRVRHQVQDLLDLGLERMGLFAHVSTKAG